MTTTLEARFLAVISHELRTPLTTIASFTESLDTDDLAPDERSVALAAVRRNTDRMLTLVDDLMAVSRLQTGDLPLQPAGVELVAVLREAADLLAVREPHTAATLTVGTGPKLIADGPLLRDLCYAVLGTVASGAADRSATVTATADPAGWTVTITARQAEQLTDELLMAGTLAVPEPPYRRRSTALWMLLADAIATRHGGSVRLTFDPAIGAGAVIRIPLTSPSG
ncbi:MAG TPA: HAMP domain-containing sensor histidine kinase [Actinoplanes sp.]|nr:HAMP domain-containing sensor histidine kinase [Actinoplanes sp.]